MTRTIFAAALATAILTTASAQAAPIPSSTYVMKAGAGDLYEITSSKLVAGSTTNPELKSFAMMMVTDHTKSTAEVKRAAMSAHVKAAPPKLDAAQANMINALRSATGETRDALYVEQQKTAHQQALALQKGYATTGATASLKKAASAIVPVVEHHISELQSM